MSVHVWTPDGILDKYPFGESWESDPTTGELTVYDDPGNEIAIYATGAWRRAFLDDTDESFSVE